MEGKLYIVATPIGNLADVTKRMVQTLEGVALVAAEDTRVTGKLLNHLGIKKELLSCHRHNIEQRVPVLLERLKNGEDIAYTCDAGTPCISDPGYQLVQACREQGIAVVPIPGASALTAALSVSGMGDSRFYFAGFLSKDKKYKREQLTQLAHLPMLLVFYEAPHELLRTLKSMYEVLGEREITFARELTKIHEEVFTLPLSKALNYYTGENEPRGEYVLMVKGSEQVHHDPSLTQAVEIATLALGEGLGSSQAAKLAAKITGVPKGAIYNEIK